ncbi:MAG: hypothetical protein HYV27_21105 [Candidatus Hydrogenedentes bacterium]|nr:hypothetical protein [Candidatus Hydrogenedentota bacterium]
MKILAYVAGAALIAGSLTGCQTTAAQDGAVLGGALGAGLGAIVGNQSGHTGEGALIGAAAGALSGAVIGDAVGKPAPRQERVVYRRVETPAPTPTRGGYYEVQVVEGANGERYERRIWHDR